MEEEIVLTEEEIDKQYSALQDSIDTMNKLWTGDIYSPDPLATYKSNQAHLQMMVAKDYWGDRDMTEAESLAASDPDSHTFPEHDDAPNTQVIFTITPREFMDRLTTDELKAIVELTRNNTDIKVWYDRALAGNIWMKHPEVDYGLGLLVSLNVITAERKTEIIEG